VSDDGKIGYQCDRDFKFRIGVTFVSQLHTVSVCHFMTYRQFIIIIFVHITRPISEKNVR